MWLETALPCSHCPCCSLGERTHSFHCCCYWPVDWGTQCLVLCQIQKKVTDQLLPLGSSIVVEVFHVGYSELNLCPKKPLELIMAGGIISGLNGWRCRFGSGKDLEWWSMESLKGYQWKPPFDTRVSREVWGEQGTGPGQYSELIITVCEVRDCVLLIYLEIQFLI